ncbi:hypothetical protein QBC32DRAFT_314942 [Pseudoneurospora amorphoporcata]|uniref:(4-O-methyl)-D-glucuronate--lignin esterase n=1 Tax=Pseudoneurospora amorphoporcata TaxID=241081 RepID=A0AAN6NWF8_9PEZI|nr:hypothetical protein QBC32DRAFT_314942 [Pseudoneurospora amorphoporcata]
MVHLTSALLLASAASLAVAAPAASQPDSLSANDAPYPAATPRPRYRQPDSILLGLSIKKPSSTGPSSADHHMLAALTVPRGLIALENDIDWLGPVATTGCMLAGRLIYKAYGGPNHMGFSLVGGHSHCQFPSSQLSELTSYIINYFLLNSGTVERSSAKVDLKSWAPWDVPTLS